MTSYQKCYLKQINKKKKLKKYLIEIFFTFTFLLVKKYIFIVFNIFII